MKKPRIVKRVSNGKNRESGCCFRSCGGSPVIQQNESRGDFKESRTGRILRRIKE